MHDCGAPEQLVCEAQVAERRDSHDALVQVCEQRAAMTAAELEGRELARLAITTRQ
jgi:hypothetical protein